MSTRPARAWRWFARSAAPVALAAGVCLEAPGVRAQQALLPTGVMALDSPEGQRLLVESDARADAFRLLGQLVTQQTSSFCGVASAVTVLNALQVPAPEVPAWRPYRAFTQDNVFSAAARRVVTPEAVNRGGVTLAQLAALLESHAARARIVYADESTPETFRHVAVANLRTPGDYVVVNYNRAELGQEYLGHVSPVAAYHAPSDRFLLLDVARYKYPPVWVDAAALFRAANTRDLVSGRSRGLLLVSPAPGARITPGPPGANRTLRFLAAVLGGVFALGLAVGAALAAVLTRRRRKRRLDARASSAG